MPTSSFTFLRRLLIADAVVSGATGVLMAAAASTLEQFLGVPAPLVQYAGLILLPFAAGVGWLAFQDPPAPAGVKMVIAANGAWVVGSILLLLPGGIDPNALGLVFIIVQAAVVAVLGELQYVGLRKSVRGPLPVR